MFLDSLGAPSLFQDRPPARGKTPAETLRFGGGGTATVRTQSASATRSPALPAAAAPPERRARSVSNKIPGGPPRRGLTPRGSAAMRSRSRSPEVGTSSASAAGAAGPARHNRSASNKAPNRCSGQAVASASSSGPAAAASTGDHHEDCAAAFLSSGSAAAASSGDYLQDFAAAVNVVREALVAPSTVRAIILDGRVDATQQVLANAAAVAVLAQGLDRMAADEQERAERALSVAEHRPRQPSHPPPPRIAVGAQPPPPPPPRIAPKATAIGPTAAAASAPVPWGAPRTPPQPPKAQPRVPPLAASATYSWPSNHWWGWAGWGSGQTGSEDGTAASSSAGWGSSSGWTSASTPFTAKSPNAISDSRS